MVSALITVEEKFRCPNAKNHTKTYVFSSKFRHNFDFSSLEIDYSNTFVLGICQIKWHKDGKKLFIAGEDYTCKMVEENNPKL